MRPIAVTICFPMLAMLIGCGGGAGTGNQHREEKPRVESPVPPSALPGSPLGKGIPGPQNQIDPLRTPLSQRVALELKATELPNHHVRLHGSTNLPEGTMLMLGVQEPIAGGFTAQATAVVLADGTFASPPIGPTRGFAAGSYVGSLLMPVPAMQPPQVQNVIGSQGENLKGNLVQRGPSGVFVTAQTEFTIGDDTNTSQTVGSQHDAGQYRAWHQKIVALHERLQDARVELESKNVTASANWASFVKLFVRDMKQYQQELLAQSSPKERSLIGTPLGDLNNMFLATASGNARNFTAANALYQESVKKLDNHVAKAENISPPNTAVPNKKDPSPTSTKGPAVKKDSKLPDANKLAVDAERKLNLAKTQFQQAKSKIANGQVLEGERLMQFARKRFANIVADYPDTPAAKEARGIISTMDRNK